MQHVRSKDTSIEIKIRKALWHEGIRYRKNYDNLPGRPDIAITKFKIAVFCDSSFWHGRNFKTKKPVETNHDYWDTKIRRNIARDKRVNQSLALIGWRVLRFWDIEIKQNLDGCINTIKNVIVTKQYNS